MSIGTQLRQAREAQSISLDQAAQYTHIHLHYLEAMEADKFDSLPSSAQLRGFLRAYGEYLKLNTNELIRSLEGVPEAVQVTSTLPAPVTDGSTNSANSQAIFAELGKKLKSQRELMGLSLGDVERHTHIRMHYVKALEEGDIAHLPSPVQGRGMLSNYATFLGLDPEAILLHFADGLQASLRDRQVVRNGSAKSNRMNKSEGVPARPSQFRRLFSMDLFVGGFLILFLLGFTVWGALRISALNSNKQPSLTAPPVSEILLTTSTGSLSGTPALQASGVISTTALVETAQITATLQVDLTGTPIVIEPSPVASNAPVQVYVVAHQQAWMRVVVDGEPAYEGRVVPGSAYSFAGNERIDLITGNGAGVQVYFNQTDLGLLGSFGQVVERVFSIAGVQTVTPSVPLTNTPAPTSTITPTPTSTPTGIRPTPSPTPRP